MVDPSSVYQNWASGKVQESIDEHIAEYGTLAKLSTLEDTIRGY